MALQANSLLATKMILVLDLDSEMRDLPKEVMKEMKLVANSPENVPVLEQTSIERPISIDLFAILSIPNLKRKSIEQFKHKNQEQMMNKMKHKLRSRSEIPKSGSQRLEGGKMRGTPKKRNKKKKKKKGREDHSVWKVGKQEENLRKSRSKIKRRKEERRSGCSVRILILLCYVLILIFCF